MSHTPTAQEAKKILACLPFALDPTLPKDAEDQIRQVFIAYIEQQTSHAAMLEALEALAPILKNDGPLPQAYADVRPLVETALAQAKGQPTP